MKKNSKIRKVLKDFGLSDNEVEIYLLSLSEPGISPFQISKSTLIPRTTVYDTLLSLSSKKLVELEQSDGFTKRQTKVFAKDPSNIRKLVRNKKKKLDMLEVRLVDSLPSLREKYTSVQNEQFEIKYGLEGVNSLNNELFREEMVINPMISVDTQGLKAVNQGLDSDLESSSRSCRMITPLNEWVEHVISYQFLRDKRYLVGRDVRYINEYNFNPRVRISLSNFQLKLICIDGDECWGMLSESEALYETYSTIFEVLWSCAKPFDQDLVKSFGENDFMEAQRFLAKKNK